MSDQLLTRSTLVLRYDYRPVAFWPKPQLLWHAKRVVEDIYLGTLEPVVTGLSPLLFRSPSVDIAVPLVARLNKEVSEALPSNRHKKRQSRASGKDYGVHFNLQNLIVRDVGCCAYCKVPVQRRNPHASNAATFDHVLPKSRGGANDWYNAVLACQACNNFKADQTPQEAGMDLLIEPWRPTEGEMLRLLLEREPLEQDVWYEFLPMSNTPRTDATLTALAT